MATTQPWGRAAEPLSSQPPPAQATSVEPFVFTGRTSEYFGIWIVNVLLTIVTLGIYSAWAKVRRLRYFYGNTHLAGSSFDYHARPVQILIGRIIVLVVLMVYNVVLNVVPLAGLVLVPLFVLALPWFVMRGLRFNARVTSFRNVRFDFHGGYWGAFRAYVLGGAVTWLTLGILAPVASRWMWRYMLANTTYGGRPITSDPALRKLYGQWLLPAVILLATIVVLGLSALALGSALYALYEDVSTGTNDADAVVVAILQVLTTSFLPFIVILAIVTLIYRAGTRNVALNATVVDGRHRFRSAIHRGRFTWITVTNLIATVLSLGLARPWAAIRMAKFLAAATALEVSGSLDDYLGDVQDTGSAVGAEYMDVEGFDFGF
ncbi:YjgN family protein [Mesorhizobium australicum]|uniref:Uncharacterized membrane protein YjgN, DUF898 family n=1 Tax=Mesorhizobium australicum TaxID=536018 RepID=A0A1X7NQQ9_9HYPH|nr:Uncharacterized membrane protein YjgN, DUF898 family [Mesorhizobium australicum]